MISYAKFKVKKASKIQSRGWPYSKERRRKGERRVGEGVKWREKNVADRNYLWKVEQKDLFCQVTRSI